jgi:hypothetical protein
VDDVGDNPWDIEHEAMVVPLSSLDGRINNRAKTIEESLDTSLMSICRYSSSTLDQIDEVFQCESDQKSMWLLEVPRDHLCSKTGHGG